MADIETITILRVDTGEAVRNVGDLRDNIKLLKEGLNGLEIGTEEYQQALSELKVNQNALRDAMYATSASMEDVAKSATGVSESYNGLVNRMKALKEEFRSTEDAARRAEIGEQIKAVNDQLKEMDALQGNFQRNVGNYANSVKEALKDIPGFAGPVKRSLDDMNKTMGLMSKQPLLAIITLLFPLIQKLTVQLKDNATFLGTIEKLTKALEPVLGVVSRTVETLAGWISKAVDWFLKLMEGSKETFKNIISGSVGVGNAILQYLLTPIRTVVEAFKGLGNVIKDVFTGNFKQVREDAAAAVNGIKDAFKKGFSFKDNFAQGREIGEAWVEGLMSARPKAKQAGKDVGKAVGEGMVEGLDAMEREIQAAIERDIQAELKAEETRNKNAAVAEKNRLERMEKEASFKKRYASIEIKDEQQREDAIYAIQLEANEKRLEALKKFQEEALKRGDLDLRLQYEQQAADLSVQIELDAFERRQEIRRRDEAAAKETAKTKMQVMMAFSSSVSGILSAIADMYEEDAEASEASANRVKGLRIAAAAIDTISGAVGAYMQAAETIPAPYGIIVGAVQAATVTATGLANIAKMKATKIGESGKTSAPSFSPATVNAPRVNVEPQQTTLVQSASQELKLNEQLKDQRVYILESDIEAKQGARKVKVQESSF